jgi:hypothetical protein
MAFSRKNHGTLASPQFKSGASRHYSKYFTDKISQGMQIKEATNIVMVFIL